METMIQHILVCPYCKEKGKYGIKQIQYCSYGNLCGFGNETGVVYCDHCTKLFAVVVEAKIATKVLEVHKTVKQ